MSKQNIPNIYNLDYSGFGVASPAGSDENGVAYDQLSTNGNVNGVGLSNKVIYNLSRKKLITSAQLKALNATPISVLPAPGAGYFNQITSWTVIKPAGTAYAGIAAGEDLALKYTNGSGAVAAAVIETTGFLDQATAQTRSANAIGGNVDGATPGDYTPVANAAVVAQLLVGEITTGNSPLYILVTYNIVPSDFVATA